jgi:hypothetical protein
MIAIVPRTPFAGLRTNQLGKLGKLFPTTYAPPVGPRTTAHKPVVNGFPNYPLSTPRGCDRLRTNQLWTTTASTAKHQAAAVLHHNDHHKGGHHGCWLSIWAPSLGWAMQLAGGRIESGTVSFRPSRYDGGGIRYLRFRAWLDSMAQDAGRHRRRPLRRNSRHLSTDAAHVHGGLLATLTAWCEQTRDPYQGVPVGTIKRFIAGKGNADKQAVIAAVRERGLQPRRRQRGRRHRHPAVGDRDRRRRAMTRQRLPNRRPPRPFLIEHGGSRFTVTVGFYPDGRPGEVFTHGMRTGSTLDALLADACVLVSLLLQHGVEPRSCRQHGAARQHGAGLDHRRGDRSHRRAGRALPARPEACPAVARPAALRFRGRRRRLRRAAAGDRVMRWFPRGYGGERCPPEQVKRDGWRDQNILVVNADDDRLTWPERELIRQVGDKLYGKPDTREVRNA